MEPDERPNLELLLHAERWGSALDDPDCLLELVEADVQAGFAEWIPGGLPEAKELYGDLCAAGRLGLVKKEGSQPCLIGDRSISNANQLSRICENVVTFSGRCGTVCISSPGYRVACLLFGHCQSPQTHPRLPRRKRSVFFRSLWIGLEQRVGWFTTPLTLAVPGLPVGGQEQQQRLLEHCIASCRVTILPLCMSMIFWRFSRAKLRPWWHACVWR